MEKKKVFIINLMCTVIGILLGSSIGIASAEILLSADQVSYGGTTVKAKLDELINLASYGANQIYFKIEPISTAVYGPVESFELVSNNNLKDYYITKYDYNNADERIYVSGIPKYIYNSGAYLNNYEIKHIMYNKNHYIAWGDSLAADTFILLGTDTADSTFDPGCSKTSQSFYTVKKIWNISETMIGVLYVKDEFKSNCSSTSKDDYYYNIRNFYLRTFNIVSGKFKSVANYELGYRSAAESGCGSVSTTYQTNGHTIKYDSSSLKKSETEHTSEQYLDRQIFFNNVIDTYNEYLIFVQDYKTKYKDASVEKNSRSIAAKPIAINTKLGNIDSVCGYLYSSTYNESTKQYDTKNSYQYISKYGVKKGIYTDTTHNTISNYNMIDIYNKTRKEYSEYTSNLVDYNGESLINTDGVKNVEQWLRENLKDTYMGINNYAMKFNIKNINCSTTNCVLNIDLYSSGLNPGTSTFPVGSQIKKESSSFTLNNIIPNGSVYKNYELYYSVKNRLYYLKVNFNNCSVYIIFGIDDRPAIESPSRGLKVGIQSINTRLNTQTSTILTSANGYDYFENKKIVYYK